MIGRSSAIGRGAAPSRNSGGGNTELVYFVGAGGTVVMKNPYNNTVRLLESDGTGNLRCGLINRRQRSVWIGASVVTPYRIKRTLRARVAPSLGWAAVDARYRHFPGGIGSDFLLVLTASTIRKSVNDGASFTSVSSPASGSLNSLGFVGSPYFEWLAVGQDGAATGRIIRSDDAGAGASWSNISTPAFTRALYGVAHDSFERVVAVGDSGETISSVNGGQSWSRHTNLITTNFNAVTYAHGLGQMFYTVAENGNIYRSSDGTGWTSVFSGTDPLRSIRTTEGGNRVWVCGDNGVIYTSSTGTGWSSASFTGTPNMNKVIVDSPF